MAYAGKVGQTTPTVRELRRTSRPIGPVAAGVAVGLLVGAGMALLFAPVAGIETRARFGRRVRRARLRGADAWDGLRFELRRARRRFRRVRPEVELAVDD